MKLYKRANLFGRVLKEGNEPLAMDKQTMMTNKLKGGGRKRIIQAFRNVRKRQKHHHRHHHHHNSHREHSAKFLSPFPETARRIILLNYHLPRRVTIVKSTGEVFYQY